MPYSATLTDHGGAILVVDDSVRKSDRELEPARFPRWLMPNPELSDDAAAMQMQRFVLPIGTLLLLAYLLYDLRLAKSPFSGPIIFHWAAIAVTLLLFAATWSDRFRRHWKLGNMAFGVVMISIFILISARAHEGDARFGAVLLFPAA